MVSCEVIPPPGSSGGLCVLWSGSSPVSARQSAAWSGWAQPQHTIRTRKPEWRLVTTVEITFITLVGQQNRAVVWGNEGWLFRGGDWWRNWALFGYWFIGPVSWAAVYSCQLGSPGHPLLATLALPGQGWVPAAACQIWQTCSSTKHRILKMTKTKISIPLNFETRDQLFYHLWTKSCSTNKTFWVK